MASADDEPAALEQDESSELSSASDSGSDSDSGEQTQVEWLATGRAKRATAGNRMKSMLANEERADEDSDLELLFAEDDDDQGFTDVEKDDASDVQMDSSSDEEDQDDGKDDDLEGEKELQRKEKEKKLAARKRKAQEAIPAKFRKKVRIDTAGKGDPTSVASEAPKPRPKKKSERASWLPSATDAPTRASERSTTRISKVQLHQQMVEREARRKRQLEIMERKARKAEANKRPPLTQAERLAEAELVESRNAKSLNRWEEAEKQREEERQAKIAALYNRTLEGPVVTFWSGVVDITGEGGTGAQQMLKHLGKMVSMEEKAPRKKRQSAAAIAQAQKEAEDAKKDAPAPDVKMEDADGKQLEKVAGDESRPPIVPDAGQPEDTTSTLPLPDPESAKESGTGSAKDAARESTQEPVKEAVQNAPADAIAQPVAVASTTTETPQSTQPGPQSSKTDAASLGVVSKPTAQHEATPPLEVDPKLPSQPTQPETNPPLPITNTIATPSPALAAPSLPQPPQVPPAPALPAAIEHRSGLAAPNLAAPSFHTTDAVFRPIGAPSPMAPPTMASPGVLRQPPSGVLARPASMLAPPNMVDGSTPMLGLTSMGGGKSNVLAAPNTSQTPSPLAPPSQSPNPLSAMAMAPPPRPPPPPPPPQQMLAPQPAPDPTPTLSPAPVSAPSVTPASVAGSVESSPPLQAPEPQKGPQTASNTSVAEKPEAPKSNNELQSTEPPSTDSAPTVKEPELPMDGKITRSCIILQNFDEDAIKDKTVQTQILFGRKMSKIGKPAHAPLCVITNHPARYRDPKTGLPYYNSYAYKEIQKLHGGQYKWSQLIGAWVGTGSAAARGVPIRFMGGPAAAAEDERRKKEREEAAKKKAEDEERKKKAEQEAAEKAKLAPAAPAPEPASSTPTSAAEEKKADAAPEIPAALPAETPTADTNGTVKQEGQDASQDGNAADSQQPEPMEGVQATQPDPQTA